MSEYTPTTAEVREEFVFGHQEVDMDGNVVVSLDEAFARWGRWLAEVERVAAEKAWLEGADSAFYNPEIRGYVDYPDENTYRREETE